MMKLVTVSTALWSTTTVCAGAGAAAACSSARLATPDERSSMRADGTAAAPNIRAAASSRSLHPPSTSTHCAAERFDRTLRSTRASLISARGTLTHRRRPVLGSPLFMEPSQPVMGCAPKVGAPHARNALRHRRSSPSPCHHHSSWDWGAFWLHVCVCVCVCVCLYCNTPENELTGEAHPRVRLALDAGRAAREPSSTPS